MIINFSADQSQKLDSHIESSEEIQLVNEESGIMLIFLHVTYFIIYYYIAGEQLEQYITELGLELQNVELVGNSYPMSWADRMEQYDANWSGLRPYIFHNVIGSHALTEEVCINCEHVLVYSTCRYATIVFIEHKNHM